MNEYIPKPGDCFYVQYHNNTDMSYRDDLMRAVAVDGYAVVAEFLTRPNEKRNRIIFPCVNWRFAPASAAIVQAITQDVGVGHIS